MKQPVMVAFGGGVNSTALVCGLAKQGERPDAILFADTGAEKPETYAHVTAVSTWCVARGFPEVITVRNEQSGPLEQLCLSRGMLPSVAYGANRRGCSEKAKLRPQHNWARGWRPALDYWKTGAKVRKLIGYGAEERYRARIGEDRWYEYDYPLIQWGWDRLICHDVILGSGLPIPPKSACFFCPFTKKREILELGERHPDLLERAFAIERAAAPNLETVKGLGAYFSWEKYWQNIPESLFGDELIDANPFGCLCVTPTPDEETEEPC